MPEQKLVHFDLVPEERLESYRFSTGFPFSRSNAPQKYGRTFSSLPTQAKRFACFRHRASLVPEERLELSPLTGHDFESCAATITPLRQYYLQPATPVYRPSVIETFAKINER